MSVQVASLQEPDQPEPEIVDLPIKSIRLSGATQPRQAINQDVVAEYTEEMLSGKADQFPPVIVFFDGKAYWCSDGFHRVTAAIKAGLATIKAKVSQGTKRDALLASFSANSDHGVRRSNIDKRRAVTKMLEDLDWARWPDQAIANACKVSTTLVRTMRNQLGIEGSPVRAVNKNGKHSHLRIARKPVLDGPHFDEKPVGAIQATKSTVFDAYLARVKARGLAVKTHVNTEYGPIDIETKDAIYIVAGDMTPQTFRNAFVTLLFQKRKRPEKRAVIVGTTTPDLNPWMQAAKHFNIEFHEFNG